MPRLRPEESLHRQVRQVRKQVESEESTGGSMQVRHEVHQQVEYQDSSGRERKVGQGICQGERGGSIHAVIRLLSENRSSEHHRGHLAKCVQACSE